MTAELRAPGGASSSAAFVFTQDVASDLWNIVHNLGMRPNVTVVDSLDREVEADITYIDNATLTVAFATPQTGKAYLS